MMLMRRVGGMVLGGVVGMVAGMMLAPQKGKKIRRQIKGVFNRAGM